MLSPSMYLYGLLVLVGAITVGYLLVQLPGIRKSFLPASVVAGIILLILGPEVFGQELDVEPNLYKVWEPLPGMLISVIFAALFLARPVVSIKKIWKMAAPQAAFGQMIAWGYYAVGGVLTLLLLVPVFGASPLAASLIEVSFEGGHGTAAGMQPVFHEFGYESGQEMAVALATTSLFAALSCGFLLIQYGRHKGYIHRATPLSELRGMIYHRRIIAELRKKGVSLREELGVVRVISHILLLSAGVGFGWVIYTGLNAFEQVTWGDQVKIFGYMPLFTFCMFGGMIAQKVWSLFGLTVSRPLVDMMSGAILAVLVTSAIATMKLGFVSTDGLTFAALALAGVVWVVFCFTVLARFIFPKDWFTNAIISVGQSMGTTATGLLFASVVDPKQRTGAVESFGYKQLLFEPLMGGGMVTALSIPLIIALGLPLFTAICASVCIFWLLFGVGIIGRKR